MTKIKDFEKAYKKLTNYKGDNNQIQYLKYQVEKLGKELSAFDMSYILNNYDYKSFNVNKVVKITSDYGLTLKQKYDLPFQPEKLLITRVIGEMGGTYHCYVQYRQSVKPSLMYIKKNFILTDLKKISVVDTPIHVDFDKYDAITEKHNRKLKELQKTGIEFLLRNKHCILADGMGSGKEQEVTTLIPTPNGWIKMGDLKIEDVVFGCDGKPYKILDIFPQGYKDVYTITFSDGTKSNCGINHLWVVKNEEDAKSDWEVLSTKELLDNKLTFNEPTTSLFRMGKRKYSYSIPMTAPVEYSEKTHKIHPYIFGLYLTNQHSRISNIVPKHKFIPNDYLLDSIENRIELLQGIMDSCGFINKKRNTIVYKTTNKPMALTIRQLIESLGGSVSFVEKRRWYTLNFRIHICPFKDETKITQYNAIDTTFKRYIKSIKLSHKNECVCIKVSSPDSTYLTNNYIVTHNTTQATVAAMETGAKKVLIICPASLKTNWKREISFYNDPSEIKIVNGTTWETDCRYTIVNYDILDNFYKIPSEIVYEKVWLEDGTSEMQPKMIKGANGKMVPKVKKTSRKDVVKKCLSESPMFLEKFDCVIIDEAHKLSNNKSIRYNVIADFLKRSDIPYIFLLTGTPLTNKPMNLYHILKLLDADITKDYYYYTTRYCDAKKIRLKTGRTITTTNGATNLDELAEKIKHIYIRRLLHQMTDMVNKEVETRYYDLTDSQMKRYNELWDEYVDALQNKEGYEDVDPEEYRQLVEGMLVRQYLAKEMTSNTIELVNEKVEDGEKVIIVCTFAEEIEIFKKYYNKKCVIYDGKMSAKEKDKSVHEFMNNPKIKVFIGQIIACSVGLTLTSSHCIVFNSYSWVAADNLQMEDRIYRLNQTEDVTCIYQLFNDSISQNMFDKVLKKQLIMDKTIMSEDQK